MLKKELKMLDVFCLAAGAMISSGLFVLPGIAYEMVGPAMILSYAMASIFVIPAMLAQAELVTAMPKAGGSYFFIERSLGPLAGTWAGLLNWISIALKSAFALIGIGAIGAQFVPGATTMTITWIAIGGCVVFTILNLVSVKSVGKVQIFLVFGLLLILALVIGAGFPKMKIEAYMPFFRSDLKSIFAVAGMVFVSFGGLTKVASVGEEVARPGKNLPKGMFLALGVVSQLYIVVIFITTGTVPAETLSGSLVPIAESARASLGRVGMLVVDVAALFAFITTANAGILSASRSPMAMSRDGLLPAFLSKTNKRFGTPHVAVLATAMFMITVIALLSIEDLVKTASTMMILMFILVNVAVIIMRQSKMQSYRPVFKTPLYPVLPILAIILYSFLIVEMGTIPLLLTGGFGLIASIWFAIYVWRRITRQSAFVYLVKRITAKAMARTVLEDELRQISLERSGDELDRFDRLIQDCIILDLDDKMNALALFQKMADTLAPRIGVDAQTLFDGFVAREKESSTVIQPGLAIPHVIIDGENRFDIVLVRSRSGVTFSELQPPVKTIFALIGTMDERNYHLRALMHIAHLVGQSEFEKRWLDAQSAEQLRDVVLLTRKKRETGH